MVKIRKMSCMNIKALTPTMRDKLHQDLSVHNDMNSKVSCIYQIIVVNVWRTWKETITICYYWMKDMSMHDFKKWKELCYSLAGQGGRLNDLAHTHRKGRQTTAWTWRQDSPNWVRCCQLHVWTYAGSSDAFVNRPNYTVNGRRKELDSFCNILRKEVYHN